VNQPTSENFRFARLAEASARLSADAPFDVIFQDGADISGELYKPVGEDKQSPHARDELYIVAAGSGAFNLDGESIAFGSGDLLFVPAHTPHRFERFSDDFSCWVIFYGAES